MKDYPISLAPEYGEMQAPIDPPKGIYLSLPDVSELDSLPACGEITFRYVRERLSLHSKEETRLSADLCLCEITKVEAGPECEEKKDDVVDKLFAEAKKEDDEDSDGSGEE